MNNQVTSKFIDNINRRLDANDTVSLHEELKSFHPVDLADLINHLSEKNKLGLLNLFDTELQSDIVAELEEDERENLLASLSPQEIAVKVINHMESDDAADLLAELSEEKKEKVIRALSDEGQAIAILDLLNYTEDTAGALMAKELIKVNVKWTINECIVELRKQAEEVEKIHTIYAVDNQNKLIGQITLKHLLLSPPQTLAESIVDKDIQTVLPSAHEIEVVQIMEKYDLVVIPVVDEIKRLLGRITIDDVVDVMKEEAEKDYQMASGISENVEYTDSIFQSTKARFPWLLIGLFGGIAGAKIIGVFGVIENTPILAYFMPLIAAMGGNVGVQSSAIVVQSIANNSLKGSVVSKLSKELGVGLLNGILCSSILLLYNLLFSDSLSLSLAVSTSLFCVIIIAALFGTWIPLMLNHFKIDPALATGPFITTANDVVGLLLYFSISSMFI
jgi:magnesium transporter